MSLTGGEGKRVWGGGTGVETLGYPRNLAAFEDEGRLVWLWLWVEGRGRSNAGTCWPGMEVDFILYMEEL